MRERAGSSALTGWTAGRFDSSVMRAFLFALCAGGLLVGAAAHAAPKKAKSSSAKKAPAGRPTAPAVKLDAAPAATDAAPVAAGGAPPTRGPTRIDFDDRLIQGQTNKSGAVYLYDRKELKIRSMIKKRESFREEIVGSLYDT